MIDDNFVSEMRSMCQEFNSLCQKYHINFLKFQLDSLGKSIVHSDNFVSIIHDADKMISSSKSLSRLHVECFDSIELLNSTIKQCEELSQSVENQVQKNKLTDLARYIEQSKFAFFEATKLKEQTRSFNCIAEKLITKIKNTDFRNCLIENDVCKVIECLAQMFVKISKKMEDEVEIKLRTQTERSIKVLETLVTPKVEVISKPEETPKKRCQLGRRLLPFMAKAVAGVALVCYAYLIAQNVNQQPFGTGNM